MKRHEIWIHKVDSRDISIDDIDSSAYIAFEDWLVSIAARHSQGVKIYRCPKVDRNDRVLGYRCTTVSEHTEASQIADMTYRDKLPPLLVGLDACTTDEYLEKWFVMDQEGLLDDGVLSLLTGMSTEIAARVLAFVCEIRACLIVGHDASTLLRIPCNHCTVQ